MLLKVIACDVFTREVCHCVARSPHTVDLEFTPKGAHNEPEVLRAMLQERIDAAEASDKQYDAIALCLGICGNATIGLQSRSNPIILPRSHDCCALFLGSKERWQEHFGNNPSTPFSSGGYLEHGGEYTREANTYSKEMGYGESFQDYVEKYGEDNARYIWKTLHPEEIPGSDGRVVFIDVPECPSCDHLEACRQRAERDGKEFIRIEGSIEWVRKLVYGEWDESRFLRVPARHKVAGVYDWQTVVKAVDTGTSAV